MCVRICQACRVTFIPASDNAWRHGVSRLGAVCRLGQRSTARADSETTSVCAAAAWLCSRRSCKVTKDSNSRDERLIARSMRFYRQTGNPLTDLVDCALLIPVVP